MKPKAGDGYLSQGHKKKAVESVSAILGGHFLDTSAKPMVKGIDT